MTNIYPSKRTRKLLPIMRFFSYIIFTLFFCSTIGYSQQISVDDSVGLQSLIEDNLVNGCVNITNISSSVNGAASGFASYASFQKAGSNFPFENGIMLSTGGASSGGNSERTPTLSEGSTIWGTDPDLEAALGITNTVNATSIEFDFVSISNQFQFNYVLASEEYYEINPCDFADGFAFLIKESGSSEPYQNIALVPGTTTPVNTSTIHNISANSGSLDCNPQNEQYFAGYNQGDTNYNGRTTVLTAAGSITPNVTYHIKLVIADQEDGTYDSAVFIEGDSFKVLDLGEDITTCASSVILDADLENNLASYAWYRNNALIPGAISPTYTAIQDGTYQVEVAVPINGSTCVETDIIEVVLNTEEPMEPISDYQLCDDSSGDGIETFDLSIKNSVVAENAPFTNYSFSYHLSDSEARLNANEITAPIQNTTSPQTIYVRVQDADTNCFSYTTFNLIVNPLPNIVEPTPLDICDSDDSPDGFAIIDLTEKNAEITSGQSNLVVSYHYNSLDVDTGANPIPTPYINSSTPDRVYVRIIDTTTGCVTTTTLDVEITISPIVNRETQYLDACDRDLDGNAVFDLTEVIAAVLNGLTGVTTTFHASFNDAEMNTNAIADETNYQYTNAVTEPGSGTIYLRIVDETTGCPTIIPFEIHTNLLLTGTDTGDFALCDDNEDSTDTLDFDLNTVETFIANDLPSSISVAFYEDEDDRDNDINAIDKTVPYPALSPQVLFVRISGGGCVEYTEINLLVNPILLFAEQTVTYCDDDNDGFASIDMAELDDTVTGGNTNFTVTYFANETDAQTNNTVNQLPPFYNNTNETETLYARLESVNTGCATVNPFELKILVAPTSNPPSDVVICDNDDDGFSNINIEDKIDEAVSSRVGLDISVFSDLEAANNNTLTEAIPEDQWDEYNTNTQTIYIRIESTTNATGCNSIVSFEAIINTLPVIPTDILFQVCEDDGDNFADFILSEIDEEILEEQTGKIVYYFENENDAITGNLANALPKGADTPYNSDSKTLYIRVENVTDSTCFDTGFIEIQVAPDPVYDPIIDFLVCDDASNDGFFEFNLDNKEAEIQTNSPDVLGITFYLSRQDAMDKLNPLSSTYTNVSNPQSIYIRIESSASFCYVVEELGINVISAPDIFIGAPSLTECAPTQTGIANFDLSFYNLDTVTEDFEVLARVKSNLTINYFENLEDINQDDGLDNTNEIADPTSFDSDEKTVYIKVANTVTGCFTLVPVELNVDLPPAINTVSKVSICDNDTKTFDLTDINTLVSNDTTLVNISYHNTEQEAEDNTSPIGNTFNYTASSHDIFIRVSVIETGCPIITSFTLEINQNPTASRSPDLANCDDNLDGVQNFDLTANNSAILGSQSASSYNITFYDTFEDAETETDPLSNNYASETDKTIYARLENRTTGCFDTTQFNLLVNPKPEIPINKIVPLCNDEPLLVVAYTGVSGDRYLWSTGETTSEIIIAPEDIGDYSVTVTRSNTFGADCETTHFFEVKPSEEAEIIITPTVNFADPNSITVEINNSRIGDYVFILDDGEPQASNTFDDVSFGRHVVTVRDLNGCMDISQAVFVFDIPKFVTPNNDNAYDTWHIIGADQLPGTLVYIYNRHGKLLKMLPYNSLGWDGTYNGHNMPSDDYWFSADIVQNGETFNIRGHFALKR